MPYAPAIKVRGGTTVYLAGVTAAPVYHHHPHRPEEFDNMPRDMEGQARAALDNFKRGLERGRRGFRRCRHGGSLRHRSHRSGCAQSRLGGYFRDAKPATTTVQVVRLATDPRCLIEINAIAVARLSRMSGAQRGRHATVIATFTSSHARALSVNPERRKAPCRSSTVRSRGSQSLRRRQGAAGAGSASASKPDPSPAEPVHSPASAKSGLAVTFGGSLQATGSAGNAASADASGALRRRPVGRSRRRA